MKKDTNKYPKGWNAAKVRTVIEHYANQSESEAIAEADAAWQNSSMSLIRVPNELAGEVRKFIASRESKQTKPRGRKSA